MILDAIPLLGKIADRVLDKVLPDTGKRDEAKAAFQMEMLKMAAAERAGLLDADTKIALAQAEINKAEVTGEDKYNSRWRSTIGYIIAASFAMSYPVWQFAVIIQSIARGEPIPRPDVADLMPILFGMLGLGAMRSYDKKQQIPPSTNAS